MSSSQPIVIQDDDQVMQKNRRLLQEETRKQNYHKAMMGSKFDVMVFLAKQDMQGTQQQKDQIIRKRIIKFFDYNCKIDLARGHFCQRMEPDYRQQSTVPVDTQMILFGVDFLGTKKIQTFFSMVNPVKITWVDDSHCKLIFQSPEDAKEAIMSNLKNPEIGKIKLQGDGQMQEQTVPKGWFDLRHYYELNFERKLQIRYATSLEKNIVKKKDSYYTTYQKAKVRFQKDLLQSQQTRQKYQLLQRSRPRRNNFNRNQMQGRYNNNRSRSRQKKGRNSRYEDVGSGFYQQQRSMRFNRQNQRNNYGMKKKNQAFNHESQFLENQDLSMVHQNNQQQQEQGLSYSQSNINKQFENLNLSFEMEQNRRDDFDPIQNVNLSNIQQGLFAYRENNNGRKREPSQKDQNEDDLDLEVQPKSSSRGYKFSYRNYVQGKDKEESNQRKKVMAQLIDLSIDES